MDQRSQLPVTVSLPLDLMSKELVHEKYIPVLWGSRSHRLQNALRSRIGSQHYRSLQRNGSVSREWDAHWGGR